MRMAVENPTARLQFKFQGIFNSSVFSELTKHTERKNDNFYEWTDAKFKTIFCKSHTVDKEAEIDVYQNLTVLSRRV